MKKFMKPMGLDSLFAVVPSIVFLILIMLLLSGCGQKPASAETPATSSNVSMEDANVTLGDYDGIPVTVEKRTFTDDDVKAYAMNLIDEHNQNLVSERTVVEKGDTVHATIYLYDEEENLVEDSLEHDSFVTLGDGDTFPEIEKALVGVNAGEKTIVPLTLPDPYEPNEEYSGKAVHAEVTVNYIREGEVLDLDTLTDEQAGILNGAESVDGFYEKVREELEESLKESERGEAYSMVCDWLLENCTVDPFPDKELNERVDRSVEEAGEMAEEYYDATFSEYCDMIGITEEDYRNDTAENLKDTIKLELILMAIGDKEGIQYDEGEYQSYIDEVMAAYGYQSEDELYDQYGEDYVKTAYRMEYVIDWLIDHAKITYMEPGTQN